MRKEGNTLTWEAHEGVNSNNLTGVKLGDNFHIQTKSKGP